MVCYKEIDSKALNEWLFNRDTIKKVLNTVMERGIKNAEVSLTQKLFQLKVGLVYTLQGLEYQTAELKSIRERLVNEVVDELAKLDRENFAVMQHLATLDHFNSAEKFQALTYDDTLSLLGSIPDVAKQSGTIYTIANTPKSLTTATTHEDISQLEGFLLVFRFLAQKFTKRLSICWILCYNTNICNFKEAFEMDNNLSVREMGLEWLDSVQLSLKTSTHANYCFFVHNHIIPYFGDKPFKDVTNKDVNTFVREKSLNGRLDGNGGLAPSSLRCLVKVLKLLFKYAEDMYNIPYCIKKLNLPKKNKAEVETFTREEQDKIVKYVMSNKKLPYLAILLSLYTGMRVGEVCALAWSDIDMRNGIISVNNTVERIQDVSEDGIKGTKVVMHSAKSDCSMRKIPIPDSFRKKVLMHMYKKYAKSGNTIYFVTGKTKHSEPRYLQRHLSVLLDECEIPRRKYHALRHTFATNCMRMGCNVKSLSEILGHADVSITLNVYVHTSIEDKKELMNLLEI